MMDDKNSEADYVDVDKHMSSDEDSGDDVRMFDESSLPLDEDTIRGLAFQTVDDADKFYRSYGARKGFNVRKAHRGYNKDKALVMNMLWECSCAGHRRERPGPKIRFPKADYRVDCKACFRVAREDGLYQVKLFNPEHNHYLLSLDSPELKCNRFISPGDKVVISILNAVGNRTCHILDLLKLTHGGPSNLSFKDKDAYNYLNKRRNELVRNGDAATAISFLDGMKFNDADFIYEPMCDENNSLIKLFWTDGFSRAQYKLFGDALVFYSTYKTNTYCYPLVILSGVDKNFKTCVFGAALMKEEDADSYIWLLEQFLKAMGGKKPLSVMTDQDFSMASAIRHVLPETKHRLCSWHIMKNCKQHIKDREFCSSLATLMKVNSSIEAFEWSWRTMVEDHDLAENSWVTDLYEKREKWSEAHCVGHFAAMMRSTQRAESLNSRFKFRVKRGFKIVELLKHYFNELHQLRVDAFDSQFESQLPVQPPKRGALYHLVNHAIEVYSNNIFDKVQDQIVDEQALVLINNDGFRMTFANCWDLDGARWCVDVDVPNNIFTCDCGMLESTSLPCCHLFSAFKHKGLREIPPCCIHQRWTSSIGKQLEEYIPKLFSASDPQRQRFMNLYKESLRWSLGASQTDADTRDALNHMKRGAKRVGGSSGASAMNDTSEIPEGFTDIRDPNRPSKKSNIANPVKAKSRGARPNTLQKCGNCGVAGHKKTKCPNKENDGSRSIPRSN